MIIPTQKLKKLRIEKEKLLTQVKAGRKHKRLETEVIDKRGIFLGKNEITKNNNLRI